MKVRDIIAELERRGYVAYVEVDAEEKYYDGSYPAYITINKRAVQSWPWLEHIEIGCVTTLEEVPDLVNKEVNIDLSKFPPTGADPHIKTYEEAVEKVLEDFEDWECAPGKEKPLCIEDGADVFDDEDVPPYIFGAITVDGGVLYAVTKNSSGTGYFLNYVDFDSNVLQRIEFVDEEAIAEIIKRLDVDFIY